MDVNAMCAKYWPGAGLRSFTVKVDKSNEGWTPLLGGWALFEGPDAPPTTASEAVVKNWAATTTRTPCPCSSPAAA